jgi:hypothetical protein
MLRDYLQWQDVLLNKIINDFIILQFVIIASE